MLLADCHVHSEFSSDSTASIPDIINRALSKGMKYFYLTDHHDIDFPVNDDGIVEFQLDTDAYLKRLSELRQEYEGIIEVRYGVELGLMSHIADKLLEYAESYDFDFIIGSSHLVRGLDPYYPEYYEGRSEIEAYREYFESIYDNIKVFQNFDVYGHLDYVIRYGPTKNTNWNFNDYKDIFEAILKTLIENGKGIEINTAGLYKGLGYPHPHRDILNMYKSLGGEIITVGSDAHTPSNYAYGFDVAQSLLEDCGFKYYTLFKKRKPEFLKI